MCAYNKLNGTHCSDHKPLLTDILRDEWGYEGNVITDWWMRACESPEFPGVRDDNYRIRAQVDVLMPGAVMAVVPIVILYLFAQKTFIAGLTSGSVKG